MQIFQAETIEFPLATLGPEESRHCIKVLRHQEGDLIYLTQGKGFLYQGRILTYDKRETQLEIVETFEGFGEHGHQIRLAVSPLLLKDRFEWIMEKAVELGATEIIPLHCHRTDVYKAKFKVRRVESILITALKQSKRSQLPRLHEVQPFEDWIEEEMDGLKLMGWCEADTPVQHYTQKIKDLGSITLLIGPEGDFTEEEVALGQEAGFLPISMGENRLRTETAAIHALSFVKFLKGY